MIDHRLLLEHCCSLDLGSQLHLLSGKATPMRHHDTSSSMWQLIRRSFEIVQRFMPVGSRKRERTSFVTCFLRVFFLPWPNSRVPRRNHSFVQLLVEQLFLGTIDYFSLEFLVKRKLVIVEVYSITDDSDCNFLFLLNTI